MTLFVCSAILSSYLLDEKLNVHGKLGCVLCLLGATGVISSAPEEQVVQSIETLQTRLQDPGELLLQ